MYTRAYEWVGIGVQALSVRERERERVAEDLLMSTHAQLACHSQSTIKWHVMYTVSAKLPVIHCYCLTPFISLSLALLSMSLSVLMSLIISSNSDTVFSETDLLCNSLSSSALRLRSWKDHWEDNNLRHIYVHVYAHTMNKPSCVQTLLHVNIPLYVNKVHSDIHVPTFFSCWLSSSISWSTREWLVLAASRF